MEGLAVGFQCVIMFVLQFGYVFARSKNIIDISEGSVWKSVWSNTAVQLIYLIIALLGISSMLSFKTHYPVILSYMVAGALSTYIAVRQNNKKHDDKGNHK